ncbi:MAG: rhodanese-like domain-containing protein, partial [Porticoccaceae bacterium]|nr:rhodanese-like domain-containing protein [Porticoccaceae bacterium]
DIRDSKEYQSGYIANAVNIPLASLDGRIVELEKYRDKTVVLVDKLGQHSASAGRKLKAAGFEVRRLQGGMGEWRSQSLPVVV